ncbi:MAG: cation:proton antiporter [Rhodothermales bacterium]|nr:cation:proton antiporter [Rhodothermales bacterium]
MTVEQILFGIVSVFVLGFGAQWLAWRIRVPSILLLLLIGFIAGPLTGFLSPASLQGEWVFAFVSLSIGVILFEGGLGLRVRDLREVGTAVVSLITIGVFITWVLASLGAHYIAGFEIGLSIQIGAILTVTGPTVVIPLLRHVRPSGRVGIIARWEGITIDPIGALLAVLVLEAIVLLNGAEADRVSEAVLEALSGLFNVLFVSLGVSITGAAMMLVVLRRRLVPDFLLNPFALTLVLATFELSNILQEESGLLTSTLMGIMLANQPYVSVRRIVEFKEDLQVVLIASLFILLSARLEIGALAYIDWRAILFLGFLILVVRPAAVFGSLIHSRFGWREKVFLSWLAPRGIVAAAVASLFAFRLEPIYPEVIDALVPIVFLVIVGTVTVYGLTLSPLARYLDLAQPAPQGLLILGANAWSIRLAKLAEAHGRSVLVIDANAGSVEQARAQGVRAQVADALSDTAFDELDLGGIGKLLAMTPNDEVNSLASIHFSEVFERAEVFQLVSKNSDHEERHSLLPLHLRGRPLFADGADHATLTQRLMQGGELQAFALEESTDYEALMAEYGEALIPLLLLKKVSRVEVYVAGETRTPEKGDVFVAFLPPPRREDEVNDEHVYVEMVRSAGIVDLADAPSLAYVLEEVAGRLVKRLSIDEPDLLRGLSEGIRLGATPLVPGVALPHARIPHIDRPQLILLRCRAGVRIRYDEMKADSDAPIPDGETEPIRAFLFLVTPLDRPGQNLRILAHLAGQMERSGFLADWMEANDPDALRALLFRQTDNPLVRR